MRIIPVLDVKAGQVVRGIAGRRAEYRPIVSQLTTSCEPLLVAQAVSAHFGFRDLYLADLDAIAGGRPDVPLYERLASREFALWVDAGLHRADDAEPLLKAHVWALVAGFESLAGPDVLKELCARVTPERVIFSLDLKEGRVFGSTEGWGTIEPLEVAHRAVAAGVRRLLVLDLARVGMNDGTGTEALCRDLHQIYPEVELIAGGGIRGRDDIRRLADSGVRAVLIASALHDGRLTPRDLADL